MMEKRARIIAWDQQKYHEMRERGGGVGMDFEITMTFEPHDEFDEILRKMREERFD